MQSRGKKRNTLPLILLVFYANASHDFYYLILEFGPSFSAPAFSGDPVSQLKKKKRKEHIYPYQLFCSL